MNGLPVTPTDVMSSRSRAVSIAAFREASDFGPNEWLVEEMYQRFQEDPSAVDPAWHEFFADYSKDGEHDSDPAATGAAGLGTLACCLIPRAALAAADDGGVRATLFGQEAAFFSRLAATGIACVWVPSVQVHAADEACEQASQSGVERLIDGWCLREDLRDAARAAVPGRFQTRERRKEVTCAS